MGIRDGWAGAGLGDAGVGWSAVVGLGGDDSDGGVVDDADRGLPPLRDMGTPRRGGGVGTSLLARFPRDKFDLILVTGDARLKGALNRATAHQLSIELCPITLPAAPGSALAAAPGAAPAEWAEAAALAPPPRVGGASDARPAAGPRPGDATGRRRSRRRAADRAIAATASRGARAGPRRWRGRESRANPCRRTRDRARRRRWRAWRTRIG